MFSKIQSKNHYEQSGFETARSIQSNGSGTNFKLRQDPFMKRQHEIEMEQHKKRLRQILSLDTKQKVQEKIHKHVSASKVPVV